MSDARNGTITNPAMNLSQEATFEISDGRYVLKPELSVEHNEGLKNCQALGPMTAIAVKGFDVKESSPKTIHGTFDGDRITALTAQLMANGDREKYDNQYESPHLLIGAHVSGWEELCSSVSVAVNLKYMNWTVDEEIIGDEGSLKPFLKKIDGVRHAGFTWTPREPKSLRDMADKIPSRFLVLLSIMSRRDIVGIDVEVELASGGSCRYIDDGSSLTSEALQERTSHLVGFHQLRLENIYDWIQITAILGPIPYMVATREGGFPLELRAQILAICMEGAHARLGMGGNWISRDLDDVTRSKMQNNTKAAGKKAYEHLAAEFDLTPQNGELEKRVKEALARVFEWGYKDRVKEVLEIGEEICPGIYGPDIESTINTIAAIRNNQSHSSPKHDDLTEGLVDEYAMAQSICEWTLRALLLGQIMDKDIVRREIVGSDIYLHQMQYLDLYARWQNHSVAGLRWDALYEYRPELDENR